MSNNKTILQQRAEALVSFGISMTERTTITSCLYVDVTWNQSISAGARGGLYFSTTKGSAREPHLQQNDLNLHLHEECGC